MGQEGQGTRMASNWIEVRMINHTSGILEKKGELTIKTAPELRLFQV